MQFFNGAAQRRFLEKDVFLKSIPGSLVAGVPTTENRTRVFRETPYAMSATYETPDSWLWQPLAAFMSLMLGGELPKSTGT